MGTAANSARKSVLAASENGAKRGARSDELAGQRSTLSASALGPRHAIGPGITHRK